MVLRVGERLCQLLAPGVQSLSLSRIDQVEGHALEIPLGDGEGGKRLIACVLAPERFEARILERLHAKRHAVDARGAVAGEASGLDGCRIGLKGDLGVLRNGPQLGDVVEDRCHGLRRHQRRRAATEEDA